jgi:hypothetical protein
MGQYQTPTRYRRYSVQHHHARVAAQGVLVRGGPRDEYRQPLQMLYADQWNAANATAIPNVVNYPMTLASNTVIVPPRVKPGQSVDLVLTFSPARQIPAGARTPLYDGNPQPPLGQGGLLNPLIETCLRGNARQWARRTETRPLRRAQKGRASNFAGDSAAAERSAGQHAHPHRAFRFGNRRVFARKLTGSCNALLFSALER